MRNGNLLCLLGIIFIAVSCKMQYGNKGGEISPTLSNHVDQVFVNTIPDSLLTNEQRELKYKLADLISENISVTDNKLTTNLTKEDFKKNGIPETYYTQLLYSLAETNSYIDSLKIKGMDEVWERSREDYKARRDSWFK